MVPLILPLKASLTRRLYRSFVDTSTETVKGGRFRKINELQLGRNNAHNQSYQYQLHGLETNIRQRVTCGKQLKGNNLPEITYQICARMYQKSSSTMKVYKKGRGILPAENCDASRMQLITTPIQLSIGGSNNTQLNNTEAGIKLNGGLVEINRFSDDIYLLIRNGTDHRITLRNKTSTKFGLMTNAEKS